MWAVLSKEEVPHLRVRAEVLASYGNPVGLLELVRMDASQYAALLIHVLPADAAWLDRLAEAAVELAGSLRVELAQAEIVAQMQAEDTEAARLAEKATAAELCCGRQRATDPCGTEAARVADPGYIPTLEEAMRNPAELVAGMTEEGPVHHAALPLGLMHFGDTATCRTAVADPPPPASTWQPSNYARCVAPDIGGRLKVGNVYQIAAVSPVDIAGAPPHPPLLDLRGVDGGPFLADRFEPIDTPF